MSILLSWRPYNYKKDMSMSAELDSLRELIAEKLSPRYACSSEERLFWQLVQLKLAELVAQDLSPVGVLINFYRYLTETPVRS